MHANKVKILSYNISNWPPLWSSGQSSGFNSRVGLERGPLSFVSTIEELLEKKSSGSGLENREYGHKDSPRWPLDTLYSHKWALISPTSGGRSVGIVRSCTKTKEFVFYYVQLLSRPNLRKRLSGEQGVKKSKAIT
jgi:hypothetical protein